MEKYFYTKATQAVKTTLIEDDSSKAERHPCQKQHGTCWNKAATYYKKIRKFKTRLVTKSNQQFRNAFSTPLPEPPTRILSRMAKMCRLPED